VPTLDEQLTEDTLGGDGSPAKLERPLARGEVVGRYVILDRLGAGGMGVVYGAYDPDLDRKLAIKLLHAGESELAQRRLLREAQIVAKLNHPNVVAIHDVGQHHGRVFLAMEFIAGQTLRKWSPGKSWREIVAVYVTAARGLAAAHASGYVHGDFKPDNVMVGDDGRVRVMDFGLAHLTGGGTDGIAGTPAYMAPEQYLGQPRRAAADQFSFCVALHESLHGVRPFAAPTNAGLALEIVEGRVRAPPPDAVPKWLRKIVLRGLAVAPEQRFPSMDALVDALANDPRARLRRVWSGVLVAGVAVGAWWLGTERQSNDDAAPCQDMDRQLAGAWDQATRTKLERALLDSGDPLAGETWPRLERNLDDYARAWVADRTEACEATRVHGDQSEALLDQRMACLDARLEEFVALVNVLSQGDASVVQRAVSASASLPELDRCADVDVLLAEIPPPEDPDAAHQALALRGEFAQIAALRFAAKIDEALVRADRAVATASSLGHPATLARALLRRGDAQLHGPTPAEAEATLIEAFRLAVEHGDAEVAAGSSAMLVQLLGQQLARFDEARVWGIEALALAQRRGDLGSRTTALTALGLSADAAGDYEQARTHFEAALALHLSRDPPSEFGLAVAYNNLGNVAQAEADFARARGDHERALALFRSALGPHHPRVADALNNLGVDARGEGQLDVARAHYERALEIRRLASGPRHPSVAAILNNLGSVANQANDFAAAREYFEGALDIVAQTQGPEHPNVGRILANLAAVNLAEGKPEVALDHAVRGLAILEAGLGPDHSSLAFSLSAQGRALILLERAGEAVAPLERAVELRTKNPSSAVDLAESSSLLGRALWLAPPTQGRDRARARELADQARAAYVEAGDEDGAAAVDAWLGR
jgi:tetratricopeptide (TPR) repeat protein/predicted Ser/Thr protein kinase